MVILAAATVVHGVESWLKTLPPEEFTAAGLQKLTPAEMERLEQLIAARERRSAAPAEAGKSSAMTGDGKKSGPGWFRALVTLQETQERPEAAEAIESRLVGDYQGWSGRTAFRLENGQIWQQIDGKQRYDDSRAAPKVKVYPGLLGSYWLEVEGVNERVKVKPVKLR